MQRERKVDRGDRKEEEREEKRKERKREEREKVKKKVFGFCSGFRNPILYFLRFFEMKSHFYVF